MTTRKDESLRVQSHHGLHVEWEVKDFFSLPSHKDYFLDSGSFWIYNAECHFRIYPQWGSEGDPATDTVCLFLRKKYSSSCFGVFFILGIKNTDGFVFKSFNDITLFQKQEGSTSKKHKFSASQLWNSRQSVASDGILRIFLFVSNPNCIIPKVEAACQTPTYEGVEALSKNFEKLFLSGSDGNVIFNVNDVKFLAHKSVLAARSTVFGATFKTDMVVKNSGIVEIKDSDPDCFKDFLIFIYSGKINIISFDNALKLYVLADKYNLEELKGICSEYMAQEISSDSVCDAVLLSSKHEEHALLEKAT